ncbi:MAG: TadE/TadG family type IV pilus assembly protein [Acidimicrobiia bacterium]
MRKRGRRSDERGAVLVETAILIPIIVLITFGLIEFSSVYQSSSVGAGAARSAARTASAEARLSTYATDASVAAATALKTIAPDEPIEMWVYKANDNGYPGANGNTSFSSCTTSCIQYSWVPGTKSFDTANPGGSGWPASSQNACETANWDSVGVYVKLSHKYITKLFGATITLTDHAVFRLEPAPTQLCG